jgi:hypothetical protein
MTVTAEISLDWECWDHKPSSELQYGKEVDKFGAPKSETRVLGMRLGREISEVTPKQLSKAIIQGRTWSPFVFGECPDWKRRRRVEALFQSCKVLGIDYDAGESADDIITRAEQLGIRFNIFHHSFSSTAEHPKFRGVIFLNEEITDLQKAKLYATALVYGLGGDTVCVDVARLYFGSRPDSVIHLDNHSVTQLSTLQSLADSVSASKYILNREASVKDTDPEWGTIDDQRLILSRLDPGKREFVRRKVLGILREIENFDGSDGTSRYECVWKRTSRIARMPETVGNVILKWVLERIENNKYFDDWDKDAEAVVKNAIAWSFDHAEPPV